MQFVALVFLYHCYTNRVPLPPLSLLPRGMHSYMHTCCWFVCLLFYVGNTRMTNTAVPDTGQQQGRSCSTMQHVLGAAAWIVGEYCRPHLETVARNHRRRQRVWFDIIQVSASFFKEKENVQCLLFCSFVSLAVLYFRDVLAFLLKTKINKKMIFLVLILLLPERPELADPITITQQSVLLFFVIIPPSRQWLKTVFPFYCPSMCVPPSIYVIRACGFE